jgi:hypothetical protein
MPSQFTWPICGKVSKSVCSDLIIVHYSLLIAHCSLLITHYSSFIALVGRGNKSVCIVGFAKPVTLWGMKTFKLLSFKLLLLVVMLASCSSPDSTHSITASKVIAESQQQAKGHIKQAATAPLNDLNIVHAEIPPTLTAALKNPYLATENITCLTLADEIQMLDSLLGADFDVPVSDERPSLFERGVVDVNDAAYKALHKAANALTPYRAWVRKLSGAERYSRKVAAAIAAGAVRRSFLKGIGHAKGCVAPAAPYVLPN